MSWLSYIFFMCIYFLKVLFVDFPNGNDNYVPPEYVIMSRQLLSEVGNKLAKRHNIKIIGELGGLVDCVNELELVFHKRGSLSQNQLREIVVDCVEELLTAVNENEKLRPFLKNYPFTINEIRLRIFLVSQNRRELYDPDISVVAEYGGKIWYDSVDRENTFRYKTSTSEDYQTALHIVREAKQQ